MDAAPKKKKKNMTVRRRIFFCRIDAGQNEDGTPKQLDLTKALEEIDALPFTQDKRYVRDFVEDRDLCCWTDRKVYPFRLRLAKIRRGDLPHVENAGQLTPLSLPEGGGIAEQTHFVVFKNGIVGCEYSHYGPRHGALPFYIYQKSNGHSPAFVLAALIRKDIQEQLNGLKDVRLIHLKVKTSFIDVIKKADEDLGSAFEANAKVIDAEAADEIEVILRRKKRKYRPWWKDIGFVRTLAANPDIKGQVSTFKVGGISDKPQRLVDVLSEQLSIQKEIQRDADNATAVNNEAAYKAIEEAYNDFEEQLIEALGIAP